MPGPAKCPEGHTVGVRSTSSLAVCTALYCALRPVQVAPKQVRFDKVREPTLAVGQRIAAEDKPNVNDRESEATDEQRERRELAKLKRRLEMRYEDMGFKEGLTGTAVEEYVVRRLEELTPNAVNEMEYRLKYGTDQARADAAKFILEAAGHGKKESKPFGASPVLIVSIGDMPWTQKTVTAAQRVVESIPAPKPHSKIELQPSNVRQDPDE